MQGYEMAPVEKLRKVVSIVAESRLAVIDKAIMGS